jgi:hypothetical protein
MIWHAPHDVRYACIVRNQQRSRGLKFSERQCHSLSIRSMATFFPTCSHLSSLVWVLASFSKSYVSASFLRCFHTNTPHYGIRRSPIPAIFHRKLLSFCRNKLSSNVQNKELFYRKNHQFDLLREDMCPPQNKITLVQVVRPLSVSMKRHMFTSTSNYCTSCLSRTTVWSTW